MWWTWPRPPRAISRPRGFGVGVATTIRWMAALTTTGTVAARPQGQARRSKLDLHEAFLRALIAETDDITLKEMRVRLKEERDSTVGLGTLGAFLYARGLTYKDVQPAPSASGLCKVI